LPGIGRASFLKLVTAYGSPREAWTQTDGAWIAGGYVRTGFHSVGRRDPAVAWARQQIDALDKSDWSLILLGTEQYPAALTQLHHPPPFLFARGTGFGDPAIGIVGGRRATPYGLKVTRQFAADLAAAGVTVVSGFARGIDTAAHQSALEAGGKTVAIWGCGPDIVYPAENRSLVDRVAESGMLITEFPFGTPPENHNFPIRNRLIAALSDGVLVSQARSRSGALLTARHAIEQNKDVFVIPGEVGDQQFVGSHELLKEGARLVTDAADILADLGLRQVAPRSTPAVKLPSMSDLERRVYDQVGGSPCHIDRLAISLGLPVGECARVLVTLELKGLIQQTPGNMISRLV
ncbi:MAG TPA: DNA-processing protein DprA, partial [candidate division Zixibacteria bacterium]|nr:DNA-processing protein DprA [candidate division Zixibacteria bacterium]